VNILEQKRKLLGHCYMGGGGSSGGGGRGANDGNAGEAEARAYAAPAPTSYGPGARDPAQQQQAAAEAANTAAQAESARQAESAAQAESARQAESAAQAESARQAESAAQAESARQAELARQVDADRAAQQAEANRIAQQDEASRWAAARIAEAEANRITSDGNAGEAEAQAYAASTPAAEAPAPAPSPLAVMSQAGQMTPENANALADQATVRQFLDRVAKDREIALSKPGEQYNVNSPNLGTSLTNAALAAVDSGLNSQTIQMSGGKNAGPKDVTTYTTNIPIARFLGYTGDPGNSALSYGEAQQLRDLKLGNLTGVNLNNMPGTGLSVMGGDGTPVGGLTYNEPGQTADSIVAATDAAKVAERVFNAVKHFIPGYGMVTLAADLLSGKKTLGDLVVSIGVNKLAPILGTTPAALTSLANGNFADAITGQLMGYAVKDVSKTYGIDPRLATIGLGELGVPQTVNKALSAGNLNLGTTRAIANAIQSPISAAANYVGANIGSGGSSGETASYGDTLGDQIDRATGNSGSSSAPVSPASAAPAASPATTPSSPLSTLSIPAIKGAGSSAGSSSSGALGDSGAATATTPANSALKESYVGGTGKTKNTDKDMKTMVDPLSAASSSVIKDESAEDMTVAKTDPFKYDFYAYGDVPDISANLQVKNGGSISSPLVEANRVVHKASGGGIMATPLMAAAGGDVPHKGSHYVQGAGGGQDDLIDARLADGEYVFDADIVAALGDGSNKEGAAKLDSMREAIRKHKRSAPVNKIPPKAKSPLAYMRG